MSHQLSPDRSFNWARPAFSSERVNQKVLEVTYSDEKPISSSLLDLDGRVPGEGRDGAAASGTRGPVCRNSASLYHDHGP